jgi:uncharacterized protein (DUF427 family)
MAENMTLAPAEGVWVVRTEGGVVAETRNAMMLHEGGMTSTVYFPSGDVATAFLIASATDYNCPVKGKSRYFHISTPGGQVRDAAWSYDAPPPALAGIAGFIAFDASLVTVERL